MITSDHYYSTNGDIPLSTPYNKLGSNNSLEELEHNAKILDNAVKKYEDLSSNEHSLEEFDKLPELQSYNESSSPLNTPETSSITTTEETSTNVLEEISTEAPPSETTSTTTAEETSTNVLEETSTETAIHSAQEYPPNQQWWSYLSAITAGSGLLATAIYIYIYIYKKYCNGSQVKPNPNSETWLDFSNLIAPVTNTITLKLDDVDSVELMATDLHMNVQQV
ncbi:hypothetical protein [Candidatus Tisiphia endosymbiont of Hybos culiciformis]|uniref:hypothetical protein n=1 Tax=Candidatus Tisiphia endosymbiont of Hybos culiciformis TaxID=3139331 RepID=UPI003CCB7014